MTTLDDLMVEWDAACEGAFWTYDRISSFRYGTYSRDGAKFRYSQPRWWVTRTGQHQQSQATLWSKSHHRGYYTCWTGRAIG